MSLDSESAEEGLQQLDAAIFALSRMAADGDTTPESFHSQSADIMATFRLSGTSGDYAMAWRAFRLCLSMRSWMLRTREAAGAERVAVPRCEQPQVQTDLQPERRYVRSTLQMWDAAEARLFWAMACKACVESKMAAEQRLAEASDLCGDAVSAAGRLGGSDPWRRFLSSKMDALRQRLR